MIPMANPSLISNEPSLALFGGLNGGLNVVSELTVLPNSPSVLLKLPINGRWLHVTTELNQANENPIWHLKCLIVSESPNQLVNSCLVAATPGNHSDEIVVKVFDQLISGQFELFCFHCDFPSLAVSGRVSSTVVHFSLVRTVAFVLASLNQRISEKFLLVARRPCIGQQVDRISLTLIFPLIVEWFRIFSPVADRSGIPVAFSFRIGRISVASEFPTSFHRSFQ